MGSNAKSMNGPRAHMAEEAERMAKFLIHAVRGELNNFMNSPLTKALYLGDILVKHYLGNIT